MIGRIICLFKGHKRGKLLLKQGGPILIGGRTPAITYQHKVFACPRCGRETRYKIKPSAQS